MLNLLAALLLTCCPVAPATHGAATADQLLAASERLGQAQRALNYPPSNQETEHG